MMAAASVLVSCEEKEENLGAPEITLDPATLEFGETGGADNAQTLTVTSTRDWTIEQDEKYDWVTVSPSEGQASSEPQTVTVTVTDNTGSDRTATIKFTANNGTVSKNLTVKQTGPEGEPEIEITTVADFLKAEVSDDVWYTLKGQITDLYNTEYGNFTLVDETGSVKVYGLTAEKVDKNDKSFSTLGLKEGEKTRSEGRLIIFLMKKVSFLNRSRSMLFILMILTRRLPRIMTDGLSLIVLTAGRTRRGQVPDL